MQSILCGLKQRQSTQMCSPSRSGRIHQLVDTKNRNSRQHILFLTQVILIGLQVNCVLEMADGFVVVLCRFVKPIVISPSGVVCLGFVEAV